MKDVNHFNLSQQTNNPLTEGGTYSQLLTKPKKMFTVETDTAV